MKSKIGIACLAGTAIVLAGLTLFLTAKSHAQTSYQIGENSATADKGPVRLARVSYLSGPVTWRPADFGDWSRATMNLPFRQGAEIWVKPNSRAEIQFDDGSMMRLGGGADCVLQTMYSDDRGEFTEIRLTGGLATLHLRNKDSEYQVDTPLSAVKSHGPSEVRIGCANTVEVACDSGEADVHGQQGQAVLHSRQRLDVANSTAPYQVTTIPKQDPWDNFNDNRDVIYEHHDLHVPHDVDLTADDIDAYGTWHDDPHYGYVWAPREHAHWRPYHDGHWVWVDPWGWTWVGDEPWGWAPYHYGTWVDEPYGWCWVPGPAVQYWSPAVVDFVDDDVDGVVAWAPLAPAEVFYPPIIDIGFRSGNWWFNFSIGGCAAYFPAGPVICDPRPWDNFYCNHNWGGDFDRIYHNAYLASDPVFVRNSRFVPVNGSRFAGMTTVARAHFVSGGRFNAPTADPRGTVFRRGRSFGSRPGGGAQISGPITMRPNRASFAPTRSFASTVRPPQSLLARNTVRGNVPGAIARQSLGTGHFMAASNRTAPVVHGRSFAASGNQNLYQRSGGQSRSRVTTTRPQNRSFTGTRNMRAGQSVRHMGTAANRSRPTRTGQSHTMPHQGHALNSPTRHIQPQRSVLGFRGQRTFSPPNRPMRSGPRSSKQGAGGNRSGRGNHGGGDRGHRHGG